MIAFRVVCLGAGLLLSGCANLLPRGDSEQPSGFDSFEAAAQAFDKVVAYRTTVEQLKELGFDLRSSPNVTLISYPQLTGRLAPDRGVPFEAIDPGIRDCIVARLACQAYEFHLGREAIRREGSFMLDFLNFRRETRVTGWRFEGLLAVRDGVVLFRSHGGDPRTDRVEVDAGIDGVHAVVHRAGGAAQRWKTPGSSVRHAGEGSHRIGGHAPGAPGCIGPAEQPRKPTREATRG